MRPWICFGRNTKGRKMRSGLTLFTVVSILSGLAFKFEVIGLGTMLSMSIGGVAGLVVWLNCR